MGKRTLEVTVTRTVYEERPNGNYTSRSWRSVPDGTLTGDVVLRIDVDQILEHLGRRALHAKTKKTRALRGAVEVFVLRNTLKREGGTNGA